MAAFLNFSPSGRDKSEGAGCGNSFSRSLLMHGHSHPREGITQRRRLDECQTRAGLNFLRIGTAAARGSVRTRSIGVAVRISRSAVATVRIPIAAAVRVG